MRRLAFWLCLFLLPLSVSATGYYIDTVHSKASFGVRLLWLDHVSGQFTRVEGNLQPGMRLGTYVVNARIDAQSVVMTSTHMRDWVLAPAFFDAQHWPTIHFVSDPLPQSDLQQGGVLSGQLTLRGVTAPVHFRLYATDCAPNAATTCQLNLDGNLKRSVFGMTADRTALSDHVELHLVIILQPEIR